MTEKSNPIAGSYEGKTIKIYSKIAIWSFSVLFGAIFGGFLLRQNLLEDNRKKEANKVLLFSIAYTLLLIFIVNNSADKSRSLAYILNMVWGAVLSEYFFKKYYPDGNYEYKKIWKALLLSLLIMIPFLLIILYAPGN